MIFDTIIMFFFQLTSIAFHLIQCYWFHLNILLIHFSLPTWESRMYYFWFLLADNRKFLVRVPFCLCCDDNWEFSIKMIMLAHRNHNNNNCLFSSLWIKIPQFSHILFLFVLLSTPDIFTINTSSALQNQFSF